jgi:hypothetical protein
MRTSTLALLVLAMGCSSPTPNHEPPVPIAVDSARSSAPPSAPPAKAGGGSHLGAHLGAWYGSGPEFPDGQLCIVFCDNGRLFLGDKRCEQTDAGDFAKHTPYAIDGDEVRLEWRKVPRFSFSVSGGKATVRIPELNELKLARVADTSPMCSEDRPARNPDDR